MRDFRTSQPDLDGKTLLVTGGTGSFGRHLVQTVLKHFKPARLIIFSRDEMKQYEMALRFSPERFDCLRYFIGDVRDENRLRMAMRGVDYVIHAAALKHVPSAEYNPFECIKTNVNGAENIVNAAIHADVKQVIALSTDKAVSPLNLYGASKLAADKIFVAANNLSGHQGTEFSVVRYGNVLGSRGSVIPFFRRLIADGADSLPITDVRMTRFWITLEQGVNFVLSSMAIACGGEIFVPKIPSMRVVDIAKAIAPNLPTKIVGIRPGEKLHESLTAGDDARVTLAYPDRFLVGPTFLGWSPEPHLLAGAEPVPEAFAYASDTNDEWLDEVALHAILKTLEMAA